MKKIAYKKRKKLHFQTLKKKFQNQWQQSSVCQQKSTTIP